MARKAGSAVFASYNIHKCVGSDRRFDPRRVQAVIGEIGADVIALQEADRRFGDRAGLLDLEALGAATGLVPVPVTNRHRGHGWHGNLVLVREGAVRALTRSTCPGSSRAARWSPTSTSRSAPSGWWPPTSGSCGTRGSCSSRRCSCTPTTTPTGRWSSWAT